MRAQYTPSLWILVEYGSNHELKTCLSPHTVHRCKTRYVIKKFRN